VRYSTDCFWVSLNCFWTNLDFALISIYCFRISTCWSLLFTVLCDYSVDCSWSEIYWLFAMHFKITLLIVSNKSFHSILQYFSFLRKFLKVQFTPPPLPSALELGLSLFSQLMSCFLIICFRYAGRVWNVNDGWAELLSGSTDQATQEWHIL